MRTVKMDKGWFAGVGVIDVNGWRYPIGAG
jgi:hypothetical protein